jgi:hypothetical protein
MQEESIANEFATYSSSSNMAKIYKSTICSHHNISNDLLRSCKPGRCKSNCRDNSIFSDAKFLKAVRDRKNNQVSLSINIYASPHTLTHTLSPSTSFYMLRAKKKAYLVFKDLMSSKLQTRQRRYHLVIFCSSIQ